MIVANAHAENVRWRRIATIGAAGAVTIGATGTAAAGKLRFESAIGPGVNAGVFV
jgi:hypothetical protein